MDTIKQVEKIKKREEFKKNEKTSRNQALQQKSHQRDKQFPLWGNSSCKVLWTILKIDKGGT